MHTQPTKQLGLQMYADQQAKQRYLEVYGQTFVDQCLELAITVVPSRRMHKTPSMFVKAKTKQGKNKSRGNGIRVRKPKIKSKSKRKRKDVSKHFSSEQVDKYLDQNHLRNVKHLME